MVAKQYLVLAVIPTLLLLALFSPVFIPIGHLPKDSVGIHGAFVAKVYDANGNLKQTIENHNLVVTTGFKGIGKLGWNANSGVSPSTYRYIALGTGSTGPAAGDTALQTEVSAGGYSRQLTSSPTYSSGVITLTGTFTGFACACTEVGVFDASSTGNMISRATYSTVNIGSSDTFSWTYTFTLS